MQEGLKAEAKLTGLAEAELIARNQARIPLKCCATPAEIARVVMFLQTPELTHMPTS